MSRYDPQRRRRRTTRPNTTAVEALLDGTPARPRATAVERPDSPGPAADEQARAARSGCLGALLGLGRR